MLKNQNGEKVTPKGKAADLLLTHLQAFTVQLDDNATDREASLVAEQVETYMTRLKKVLGVKEEASASAG